MNLTEMMKLQRPDPIHVYLTNFQSMEMGKWQRGQKATEK